MSGSLLLRLQKSPTLKITNLELIFIRKITLFCVGIEYLYDMGKKVKTGRVDQKVKTNLSFEELMKKALNTPLPKKGKKVKKK